jgi:hypothetical protein
MLEQEVNMCKIQWQKSDHQLGGYLCGWVITEICKMPTGGIQLATIGLVVTLLMGSLCLKQY